MIVFLFFLSGCFALIYQVVWVRQLVLVVGSTNAAVSTVIAVFMAGLGIGAWLFGPLADRRRSPLKLYAYLELGIGLYALALPSLIAAWTPGYVALARELAGRPAALSLLRVGSGFALLLTPTILMGGTLPVLVRYVGRSLARFGGDLGALYGANLAGAVAGSLVSGFVLIRLLGVQGATRVAVLGNLLVALAALFWAQRAAPEETAGTVPHEERLEERLRIPARARLLVWAAVFLSGYLGMAYEVLWTRMLIFTFSSTVYSFTLILAAFLTGLALGSRLFVMLERRRAPPLLALGATQMMAGVAALLLIPLATRSHGLIGALTDLWGPTGGVFLAGSALSAAAVMLVPATLMGVALPLGMRILVDDLSRSGRRVGAAYLVNTVGSVAGALVTGFAMIPLLGLKAGLGLVAVVQVGLGWAFLSCAEVSRRQRLQLAAATGSLLVASLTGAVILLRGPNPFDTSLGPEHGTEPVIEAHRDGVGSSVTVVRYPGARKSLRIDGFEAAANSPGGETGYMPMMTHLPMLLHPEPRRILVVCFGTGSTAGAALAHPGASVDVVDISADVFGFASHFEDVNHGVARDDRARLIVDDGRNFLLTAEERYDVVTSEPMPPQFAGVVNLYSREYYELAHARLRRGGFVVQWLPFHLLTLEESLGILKTVQDVFPETTLWIHSSTGIIVARRDLPVRIDLARLERGMHGPLRDQLELLGVRGPLDFVDLHALGPDAIRTATQGAPIYTDDRPSLEFHNPRHRLLQFRGPFTREQARTMEVILPLRAARAAPLVNAGRDLVARSATSRRVQSHRLLGDTYFFWGYPDQARAAYETAARHAVATETQAGLFLLAAESALMAGEPSAARRLAHESLAVAADPGAARLFLTRLDTSAPAVVGN